MLKEKIQDELTKVIKERHQEEMDVLRYVLSEIKNKEIEKQGELSDEEVVKVIQKEIKKLREANELFAQGKRLDLVRQNESQISIMSAYLPAEMSDEELIEAVGKIITENHELYEKSPNAIIGVVMRALGSKADSQRILNAVRNYSE